MFHVKQWMKVPVKSKKIESLNTPEENFGGRIFIFCPFIRCGKGGGGPERVNQEISQKGFFCIVKREKFWNVSLGMPLPFPGFYFYRKKYQKMFHVKQRVKVPTVSEKLPVRIPGEKFYRKQE